MDTSDKCCYCDKNINGKYEKGTREHPVPKSKDKKGLHKDFVLWRCLRCNRFRRNKKFKHWSYEIQKIIDTESNNSMRQKYNYSKKELINILKNIGKVIEKIKEYSKSIERRWINRSY